MSYFGPNDYGYDPPRHDLYLYEDDPNIEGNQRWAKVDQSGYNPNNMYVKQGYNFSCMSFKDRATSQYFQMHRWGVMNPRYQHDNDPVGNGPQGHPARAPRVTLISDRWAIVCGHYSHDPKKICWEQTQTYEDDPNSPNFGEPTPGSFTFITPNGTRIKRDVDVTRLRNTGTSVPGEACENRGDHGCISNRCPQDVCNLPSRKTDIVHPNDLIRWNSIYGGDRMLVRVKGDNPLPIGDGPDQLKPASLPDNSFFRKWFHDPDGDTENFPPKYQQPMRSCIRTDQHYRTGVCPLHVTVSPPASWHDSACGVPADRPDNRTSGYEIHVATHNKDGDSSSLAQLLQQPVNIPSIYGKVRTNYLSMHEDQSPIEQLNFPTSPDAWPDDYTPADDTYQSYPGDSSSPLFYPITDLNGNKKLVYMGFISGGESMYDMDFVEAVKAVISEYTAEWNASRGEDAVADSLPDIIKGDDVVLETRPEEVDGYRIYRSEISKKGPFVDVTPAVNNYETVPYRRGNSFIDLDVLPDRTYWYYVTGVNVFESNTGEYEGFGSDIIEVTVPSEPVGTKNQAYMTDDSDGPPRGRYHINREAYTNFEYRTSGNVVDEGVGNPPKDPLWRNLIDGYRLGDNNYTIPFFGFINPFETPIQPGPDHGEMPLYYKIEGGQNGNIGLVEGNPMPNDPTTYPYVLGYRYEPNDQLPGDAEESNYKLSIGVSNINKEAYETYLTKIHTLWLSRYFPNTNNDNLRQKLEPYYQSRVYFNNIPKLKKLVLNPARYGNGRDRFGEDWSYCESSAGYNPESYLGYYTGLYLRTDIEPLTSELETLIAKDSNVDSGCQSMEYFNISGMNKIKHLDLSGNEIYVFDFDPNDITSGARMEELNLSNNKIGKSKAGSWVNDSAFPNIQESLRIFNNSDTQGHFKALRVCDVSNNDIVDFGGSSKQYTNIENLNISNNPRLGRNDIIPITCPYLKYLNASNTSLQKGIKFKDANSLKNILIENGTLQRIAVDPNTSKDTFSHLENVVLGSSSPFLETLNFKYGYKETDPSEYPGQGVYHEYGYSAYNLRTLDVSNCPNLKYLYLPRGTDQYDEIEKTHIEVLNISNTKLGRGRLLDEFIFVGPEFRQEYYPEGHTLEIIAHNVKDLQNNPCTLSLVDYISLVNEWEEAGKSLIIHTDNIS
jgi:hypothetical protein